MFDYNNLEIKFILKIENMKHCIKKKIIFI